MHTFVTKWRQLPLQPNGGQAVWDQQSCQGQSTLDNLLFKESC